MLVKIPTTQKESDQPNDSTLSEAVKKLLLFNMNLKIL